MVEDKRLSKFEKWIVEEIRFFKDPKIWLGVLSGLIVGSVFTYLIMKGILTW